MDITRQGWAVAVIVAIIIATLLHRKYIKGRKLAKEEPVLRTFSKGETAEYQEDYLNIIECTILNRNRERYDIILNKNKEVKTNINRNKLHKIR